MERHGRGRQWFPTCARRPADHLHRPGSLHVAKRVPLDSYASNHNRRQPFFASRHRARSPKPMRMLWEPHALTNDGWLFPRPTFRFRRRLATSDPGGILSITKYMQYDRTVIASVILLDDQDVLCEGLQLKVRLQKILAGSFGSSPRPSSSKP